MPRKICFFHNYATPVKPFKEMVECYRAKFLERGCSIFHHCKGDGFDPQMVPGLDAIFVELLDTDAHGRDQGLLGYLGKGGMSLLKQAEKYAVPSFLVVRNPSAVGKTVHPYFVVRANDCLLYPLQDSSNWSAMHAITHKSGMDPMEPIWYVISEFLDGSGSCRPALSEVCRADNLKHGGPEHKGKKAVTAGDNGQLKLLIQG